MRSQLIGALLVALASSPAWASPAIAVASSGPSDTPAWEDDGATSGDVYVNMNSDYAKVRVGDQEWDAVEYERNGKRAIIKGIELDDLPLTITLTPTSDESLAPASFEVVRKDFKRKRVSKVWLLVAKKTVKFKKAPKTAPTPKPDKQRPPKPIHKPAPGDAPDDL